MDKPVKRVQKAQKYITEIEDVLKFYLGNKYNEAEVSKDGKHTKISEKITYIKNTLQDLGMDQKQHNRRLWNNFKKIFME